MNCRWTRRDVFARASAAAATVLLPARLLHAADAVRFQADPFSLGVASGYPTPNSVVFWTRLAPEPKRPGGGIAPTEATSCVGAINSRRRSSRIPFISSRLTWSPVATTGIGLAQATRKAESVERERQLRATQISNVCDSRSPPASNTSTAISSRTVTCLQMI